MFADGEIWVIFNKIILQHHFFKQVFTCNRFHTITPLSWPVTSMSEALKQGRPSTHLPYGGTQRFEDLIPNFEDVLIVVSRWEGGDGFEFREEKVASLKWWQLLFSSKCEGKKQQPKKRRERDERKHSNLRFSFPPAASAPNKSSVFHKLSGPQWPDLSLSFLCNE